MANGIDPQYTGIGRVPIVQESPDTSFVDLAKLISDWTDKEDAKKLEAQKVSDLKEYRENSLDIQSQELDNLKTHQNALRGIQQQNADTAKTSAEATATTAELNSKTAYYNSIGDPKRRLIAQMADPRWKELTGHTNKSIGEEIKALEDYEDDVTLAEGFTTSNNPLQIKYHMQKLKDGDMSGNKAAGETYSNLQKQLKEAGEFQKKLYEVTPKEIAEMYPQYAKNLESIAGHFMPQLTIPKNLKGDQIWEMMKRQEKHIPIEAMEEYNKRVQQVTNAYSNEYRIAKGIGTYEGTKVGEATPFPAETEGRAAFKITPDDYTLSEERYELIEKAQEENNPLWEKWLNEEDYTFADLKMDYEAGQPELEEKEKVEVETKIKPEDDPAKKATETDTKDMTPKTISMSLMSPEEMTPARPTPPMMDATYKGQKINLPMWKELYGRSKHPVTKKAIPEYAWMDDYAKMLTGDPNAEAEDLLTKKGMKHWKKIK
jgi:hypothetical protein